MNNETRYKMLNILSERYHGAKVELNYTTPFQLLVAVVLSAQATDKGVNQATDTLFLHVKEPQDVLDLGVDSLKDMIRTIGLYNTKAEHVVGLSHQLIEKHRGQVPRQRRLLEALPGVGRKTANVVMNVVFGYPTIAVDTHIFRVSNRTGLAKGRDPLQVEKRLLRVVPAQYKLEVHQWLIQLGRYVCVARRPKCDQCPIEPYCEFLEKRL